MKIKHYAIAAVVSALPSLAGASIIVTSVSAPVPVVSVPGLRDDQIICGSDRTYKSVISLDVPAGGGDLHVSVWEAGGTQLIPENTVPWSFTEGAGQTLNFFFFVGCEDRIFSCQLYVESFYQDAGQRRYTDGPIFIRARWAGLAPDSEDSAPASFTCVPTPGTVAMLGVGALMASRRRRA